MEVVIAPHVYNFSRISESWDYQVKLGVKPVVELSFMPAYLANCTWHGYDSGSSPAFPKIVNPGGNGSCKTGNFYEGANQLPQKWEDWYDLVFALASHAVERYGIEVVKEWRWEVWNEFWGMPFPDDYMKLYNASAHAVKNAHKDLQVGGPSSNGAVCCIETFIDVANNMSAPFDFVSGHIYPIEGSKECPDANGGPHWNNDCMIDHVGPIAENVSKVWRRKADGKAVPLVVSEYAVAGIEGEASHQLDSSSAAAFIFRTVGQFDGVVDVLSYWCAHAHVPTLIFPRPLDILCSLG
jgi:xylan 1,4-beta-xylosidase